MSVGSNLWAFVGLFSGIWRLLLVALVALVLYGRLGMRLPGHPLLRLLQPWSARPAVAARTRPVARLPWYADRWFIFFLVLAATAVAAWIVTRMTLLESAPLTR